MSRKGKRIRENVTMSTACGVANRAGSREVQAGKRANVQPSGALAPAALRQTAGASRPSYILKDFNRQRGDDAFAPAMTPPGGKIGQQTANFVQHHHGSLPSSSDHISLLDADYGGRYCVQTNEMK